VLPKDPAGFSVWLQEHYLEHVQFVTIFQSFTPPVFIPDYNFAKFDLGEADEDVRLLKARISAWLEAHQATHQQLRTRTGVSGIDLADVDLTKEDEWFIWMDTHADEHAQIRSTLGIV
jgi:hypothetical protein